MSRSKAKENRNLVFLECEHKFLKLNIGKNLWNIEVAAFRPHVEMQLGH